METKYAARVTRDSGLGRSCPQRKCAIIASIIGGDTAEVYLACIHSRADLKVQRTSARGVDWSMSNSSKKPITTRKTFRYRTPIVHAFLSSHSLSTLIGRAPKMSASGWNLPVLPVDNEQGPRNIISTWQASLCRLGPHKAGACHGCAGGLKLGLSSHAQALRSRLSARKHIDQLPGPYSARLRPGCVRSENSIVDEK